MRIYFIDLNKYSCICAAQPVAFASGIRGPRGYILARSPLIRSARIAMNKPLAPA